MTVKSLKDHGLLLKVLNHLDAYADIARCSSVSRSWREIASSVQPSGLNIPGYTYQGGEKHYLQKDDADFVLAWLQAKHEVGDFKHLRYLRVELAFGFSIDCYEGNMLPEFCLAVLKLACTLPLEICDLDGNFDFHKAVDSLPASIKHLQLTGYQAQMSHSIHLSKFAKLTKLETLVITLSNGDDNRCSCPIVDGACFVLTTSFPMLRHMYLFPWPTRLARSCTFDSLLPSIRSASLLVPAHQVQALISLPDIEYLAVILLDSEDAAMAEFSRRPDLQVQDTSKLTSLKILKNEADVVRLTVKKAGLDFEVCGSQRHGPEDAVIQRTGQPIEPIVPWETDYPELHWFGYH